MKKKTLVLIVGMHRSGTSAMSGILSTLGLNLGSDVVGAGKDNEKGFFENRKFLQLNKDILSFNNGNWDDVPTEIKYNKELNDRLKVLLKEEFLKFDTLVIKDPRISLLHNQYYKFATGMQYKVKTIIILRNPHEIVDSLIVRNKFERGKCYEIISKYYFKLLDINHNNISINFNELIHGDRVRVVDKLCNYLNINYNIYTINAFLDKKLKHHNYG